MVVSTLPRQSRRKENEEKTDDGNSDSGSFIGS